MAEDTTRKDDVIELSDEQGKTLQMQIDRYFFYNGEEFVLLHELNPKEDDGLYVMKVSTFRGEDGDEWEEFEMPEYKALLKELGVEGEWEGIGHCAVGYIDGVNPEPAERKAGRVFWAE